MGSTLRPLRPIKKGPAILDDPEPPRGDLVVDSVVEHNDGVGHVLFEPVTGERSLTPLAGDDRGHALVLQPPEEARQLHTQDARIGESREQRLDGV